MTTSATLSGCPLDSTKQLYFILTNHQNIEQDLNNTRISRNSITARRSFALTVPDRLKENRYQDAVDPDLSPGLILSFPGSNIEFHWHCTGKSGFEYYFHLPRSASFCWPGISPVVDCAAPH